MKKIIFLLAFTVSRLSPSFAQTPALNSLPGASAVLFLDFDGHTVSNTSWNYDGPIICGASGLNNQQVTEIFSRVAEDYRPFDVNVTTDSTRYLQAPFNKRMRAVVTVSWEWYGAPAGGVAFTGSFTWGDDSPCFIFSGLLNNNVKNIAEACSHEIGHTLGLYHQAVYDNNCVKTSDYNYGNGSGEIGWAPIMGVGYYRNFTVWHNGPNPYGCTNYQNEMDLITSLNGFGLRPDDHAETFAAASVLSITNGQFSGTGIIEKNSDKDMFKLTLIAPGRFQLNAVPNNLGPDNAGANLDLQVILYNSAQVVLNTYNPGTKLGSVVDTSLLPGTYYIRVEGRGNMYAPDYASLGQYTFQGLFSGTTVLAVRKLHLKGRMEDAAHKLDWEIDADETVVRQVVEISENGLQFRPLAEPAPAIRHYQNKPVQPVAHSYRLHVYFNNGKDYYSNTILIAAAGKETAPRLAGTLVRDNIALIATGTYDYAVYNAAGSLVRKGVTMNGTTNISATGLPGGYYFILVDAGPVQYKLRVLKNE
jgi:hypothetical protein